MAVVGGGIVGLSTARALIRAGVEDVVVLEAENTIAQHQTGRNSGVIHSGLYYQPGSVKARACARGRESMYRYCDRFGIPYRCTGKLVVATSPAEVPRLDELARRGNQNGLQDLRRLDSDEVSARAPGVKGIAGLWVPQTGITDFSAVAQSMRNEVERRGGSVLTGRRVRDVDVSSDCLRIATARGDQHAKFLVNCAGLQTDRVARMCGVDPGVKIVPFRGDYFRVVDPPSALATFPVYPVPDPRLPFLGVHFTPDLDGRVEAGPNAALAPGREGYRLLDASARDLADTLSYPGFWRLVGRFWRSALREVGRSASRRAFARASQSLVPGIDPSGLERSRSGVRAQAVERDGTLVDDFRLESGPRSLHVVNAPSPAATASLAIGEEIAHEVRGSMFGER